MSKNLEGPPCQLCSAALRPRREKIDGLSEEKARELKRIMDPKLRPSLRRAYAHDPNSWGVTYQIGWGLADAFCSGDCAQRWAYKRVKRYRFDPRRSEA